MSIIIIIIIILSVLFEKTTTCKPTCYHVYVEAFIYIIEHSGCNSQMKLCHSVRFWIKMQDNDITAGMNLRDFVDFFGIKCPLVLLVFSSLLTRARKKSRFVRPWTFLIMPSFVQSDRWVNVWLTELNWFNPRLTLVVKFLFAQMRKRMMGIHLGKMQNLDDWNCFWK